MMQGKLDLSVAMQPKSEDQRRREKLFMDEMMENGPDPQEEAWQREQRQRMREAKLLERWNKRRDE